MLAIGWMMLGMLFVWGLLIFAAVWLVGWLFQNGAAQPKGLANLSPREVLDLRYSRGEITREQYTQMKIDLNQ